MPYVDESYEPVAISAADRSTLSEALAGLAKALEVLVIHARESSWPVESRAVQWAQAWDEMPTREDIGEVHLLIHHIFSRLLAAVDHIRGAAAIVGQPDTHVALATVARGCIESFGKASYVLTAASAVDAVHKNLQMIRGEMQYLGKYSEVAVAGVPLGAEVFRRTIKEVSRRFGVTDQVTVTTVASALLNRGSTDETGRHYYSHISSFAHAEVDTINIFLTRGNLRRPELPVGYAFEWAGMCTGTATIIGRDIIEFFGVDEQAQHEWNTALGAPLTALRAVRQHIGYTPVRAEK